MDSDTAPHDDTAYTETSNGDHGSVLNHEPGSYDDPGIHLKHEPDSYEGLGSNLKHEPDSYGDAGSVLKHEPGSYDDPDAVLEPETALNNEIGIDLDRPTHHLDNLDPSKVVEQQCVNCGTDIRNRRKHNLKLLEVQSVIRKWTAPKVITSQSVVCHSCWTLALNASSVTENYHSGNHGHHRKTCVNCGCSILRARSHVLNNNNDRETHIKNVISQWTAQQQVNGSNKLGNRICHPCWQRADRVPVPTPEAANVQATTKTITLPHILRAADTQTHCFYPDCTSQERLCVPLQLRVKLFTDLKYYIPKNCRICSFHLQNDKWDELIENIVNPNHTFTVDHIQDFASFVKDC